MGTRSAFIKKLSRCKTKKSGKTFVKVLFKTRYKH
jgi:hypothetical protein